MKLQRFLGIQNNASSTEKIVSTLGGIIAITCIAYITWQLTGYQGTLAILPSMGAATVLLFAVPHGPLSQPWALFAGNLLSALVGVACVKWIGNIFLAAGLAVGLSIAVMHLCRCIHPPGGATALAAVIGGEAIHNLGFGYVLAPTLINCLVIFSVAMLFNNMFVWRRYPLSLVRYQQAPSGLSDTSITEQHIEQAIHDSDMVVDVCEKQLKQIFDKANEIRRREKSQQFDLELGAFYTNGKAGLAWSVRHLIDERSHPDPNKHLLIYQVVEGAQIRQSGCCTVEEFADWAQAKMAPVYR